MKYSLWCLAVLLGCCLLTALPQDVPQPVTLRVKVVDGDGAPVAGASVVLDREGQDSPQLHPQTDADGVAEIAGVKAGVYYLWVHAREYVLAKRQRLVIGGNEGMVDVAVALVRGCQILGRVRLEPDLPPAGAKAYIRRDAADSHWGPWPLALNADGEFSLATTEFGLGQWSARLEGYGWASVELDTQPGGLIEDVEFTVSGPSGSVSGAVIDDQGHGKPGVYVVLVRDHCLGEWDEFDRARGPVRHWNDENRRDQGQTNASAVFTFDDIPAGRYYVVTSAEPRDEYRGHAGPIEVKPGRRTANVRVVYNAVEERSGVTIRGTLRAPDGTPLPDHPYYRGWWTQVFRPNGSSGRGGSGGSPVSSDGQAQFAIRTEGQCHRASVAIWGEGVLPMLVMGLEPDANGVLDIDRTPTRLVRLVARRGPDGPSLAGALFSLSGRWLRGRRGDHLEYHDGGRLEGLRADADGCVGPILMDTGAGVLYLERRDEASEEQASTYRVRVDLAAGTDPITLPVEFPELGSIAGRMVPAGQPLALPVVIEVFGNDPWPSPDGLPGPPLNMLRRQMIVPAGQTDFAIEGLEAGLYRVQALDTGSAIPPQASVQVQPGQATSVELAVPKTAGISGRVTAEAGPLPPRLNLSAAVDGHPPLHFWPLPLAQDGTFSVDAVPIGRLVLSANAEGYASGECRIQVPQEGVSGVEVKLTPREQRPRGE